MNLRQRLLNIHRFLSQHLFYPLALSSALACAFLAARVVHVDRWSFFFLVWNLFLAWLPYLLSLWAATIQRRRPHAWWRLLLPGALWLLFFPNAPYVVTDLVHLRERPPVPLWYDLGLLAAFAFAGSFLAVASLHIMQTLVRRLVGATASWLFALSAVGLGGLGVYLGRFERWNSWDVFLAPHAVVDDALRLILAPAGYRPLAASAMFAALLLTVYVMFVAAYHGGRAGALAAEEERTYSP
jgi:uncharacterized membrane protein